MRCIQMFTKKHIHLLLNKMTTEHKHSSWSDSLKINQIGTWYQNNRKNANMGLVGLLVLVAGVVYYFNFYKPGREKEAASALFMSERYFEKDSMNLVLKGDGKYPSAVDVADEYGNTKAGNLAKFYAGRAFMSKKDFKSALNYLEDAEFTDEIMAAVVIGLTGDCQSELGETEKAAETYMKAATKRDNLFTSPLYLMKAGLHFEEAKNYEAAVKAYTTIRDKYKESQQAQFSAKYIARASTSMGKSPE